jgi:hypothetical protein
LDDRLLTGSREREALEAFLPNFFHGAIRTQPAQKFVDFGADPEELVGEGVFQNNPPLTAEELTACSDGRS